jgi:hypothetical protein
VVSEDFLIEGMLGYSYYSLKNSFVYDKNQFQKITGSGPILGGKVIYTLDREGIQQVFVAAKLNLFFNGVYNENPEIRKYYNHSIFPNLGLGYRYNF